MWNQFFNLTGFFHVSFQRVVVAVHVYSDLFVSVSISEPLSCYRIGTKMNTQCNKYAELCIDDTVVCTNIYLDLLRV